MPNSLYKTELCRSWRESGSCRYGSKCQFAHGQKELRPVQRHPKYRTEPCRTFATTGMCPYADLMSDHALADNGHIDMRALNGHAAHMDGGQRLDPVYAAFLVHLLQQISTNAPTMFTGPGNGTLTPQHASYNASDGRASWYNPLASTENPTATLSESTLHRLPVFQCWQ
ncbi:hypothetical protein WJX75_009871 [Coccomyxa subellipsoidea]|uniref:C3H1-type domain-containing protein n=1 Tax=Coccomyxa subellipsoidea TaxID=248742 RepID=A0ABR2YC41_9CHLO